MSSAIGSSATPVADVIFRVLIPSSGISLRISSVARNADP